MTAFRVPLPELQVAFYEKLREMRKTHLLEALLKTVTSADIGKIDAGLRVLVSNTALQRMAGWGLRGEIVFAVPYLLECNPRLLGYYRLLLGFSQKQFYGAELGFQKFKPLEERGVLKAAHRGLVRQLCAALCQSAEFLVLRVEELSETAVRELTILTLGPQLRGGVLNLLGTQATKEVFRIIKNVVSGGFVSASENTIAIRNAAGRFVEIEFASDPDVRIRERLQSDRYRNIVAIEIKGGSDRSNIHNRLGEAEKSHQKARNDGFVECWTIVRVKALDLSVARSESPSTDKFYNLDELMVAESDEFADFSEHLRSLVGLSD
jgi:hypothetical protein